MNPKIARIALLSISVLWIFNACEKAEEEEAPGAIVGTWNLNALSGTYLREVALPADSAEGTTFALTVSWNYSAAVLGDASLADQTLKTFSDGDAILDTTLTFSEAGLEAAGIELTAIFRDDDLYQANGTYPTLRVTTTCSTYLTIPQITDQGTYTIDYNADETGGTLAIAPDPTLGEQVLPPFDDAEVTFTSNGNTMGLLFKDRDAHDELYAEVMDAWSEEDNRVTMGIPTAPVDEQGGYFTSDLSQPQGNSGYIFDPLGDDGVPFNGDEPLATWGYFYTYNAVMFGATGNTAFLVDDSDHDFANASAGGKLTMVVNNLCLPVNELITFDATLAKQP